MRPFSSLGVKPFLFASTSDQDELKGIFVKLSRTHHPDLFASADEKTKAEHEAKLSQINSDYALLKDPIALITQVVGFSEGGAAAYVPPPELAMEYFELQELWEEQGIEAPVSKLQGRNLAERARLMKKKAENELFELAQFYPYRGRGEGEAPWDQADLQKLRIPLQVYRYAERLLNDLNSKYPSLEL